jgi:heat shock protein HslJ
MKHSICWLAAALATAACEPADAPPLPPAPIAQVRAAGAVDDGSFLGQIDPLGGQWQVESIGGENFRRFKPWVNFSAGGFLNHGAGCSGGFPAFYRLEGQRLAIVRREAVRTGKCASATAQGRAAAAASERKLADFLDNVAAWVRPDEQTLLLSAKDGMRARLTRPIEPNPDLAGRWIIETIGGQRLVTERRPPTLAISMGSIGAYADCNSGGAPFTLPAPGRIAVTAPVVSTAIGCPPEDAAEDALMIQAITTAKAYRIAGERLILSGGPGLVARRPPPPNRQLAGEYRACGNTLLGGYHDGPITLAIEGRTVRDNAGCTAEYAADGPRLTLKLADSAACAPKPQPYVAGEPVPVGGAISTLAVTRPDGFGFDDHGRLILRTGRGLLTMCRKGSPPPFGD